MKDDLTWIELSKSAFRHNINTIRKLIGPNVLVAPCVKANAYGHGLLECAEIFTKLGADWLCVDSVDEAIVLRQRAIICPMMIMGYVGPKDLHKVVQYKVRVFLYDFRDAQVLSYEAQKQKKKAYVHIKVDTGMHRQGIILKDLATFLVRVKKLSGLKIEGIATHFATSDDTSERKRQFYFEQKKIFSKAIEVTRKILGDHCIIHSANSGALLTDPSSHHDLVRPGISMYGYYPSQSVKAFCSRHEIILIPALSLYTTVAQIKDLAKGDCVSYGCTFIASKRMKIAVLPFGYYDGMRFHLSNRGYVLIHGKRAKIIGRVCMNIMMVDVTEIPRVQAYDQAVIIGKDGREQIDADHLAQKLDTINYEILTQLRESIRKHIIP